MSFTLENAPSQKGKIAIVTGANIGLGFETTKGLAQKEATVIMACRNLKKGEASKNNILKKIPDAQIEVIHLDLSELSSVRKFAKEFKQKYAQLDLLINNAGILIPPFTLTKDGFESQMGVNYFGHYLLTNLLFERLNQTTDSRIVILSSIAHKKASINFENLNSKNSYSNIGAYSQSKLACLMFGYELQRRILKNGSNVKVIAAHPGVSNTNIGHHVHLIFRLILAPFLPLITHSPKNAALPTLLAAFDTDVKGGEYYGPTGFREMHGKPGKVRSSLYSHKEDIAKELWSVSEELTRELFSIE